MKNFLSSMENGLKEIFIKQCKEFLNNNSYPDFIINEIKQIYFEYLFDRHISSNHTIEDTLRVFADKIIVNGYLNSRRNIQKYIETKYSIEFFSKRLKNDVILEILYNKKEIIINDFIKTNLKTNIQNYAENKINIPLNNYLVNRFKKYVYVTFVEMSFNSEKKEYRKIAKSFIEKYYYIKSNSNYSSTVKTLEDTIINSILNILKENKVKNINNKNSANFIEFIDLFLVKDDSPMARYNPDYRPFFKWVISTYYKIFIHKKTKNFYREDKSVKNKIIKMYREIRRYRLLRILKYVGNSYSKVEPKLKNKRLLLKVYKKNKSKGFCEKTRKYLFYKRIKKEDCVNPNYITEVNDNIIDYFSNFNWVRHEINQTSIEVVYKNHNSLNNEENIEYKISDKQFNDIDFSLVELKLFEKINLFLEDIPFRKGIGREIKDFIIENGAEHYFNIEQEDSDNILIRYDKNKILNDFLEKYKEKYNQETFIRNNNAKTFFDKIHKEENQEKLAKLLKEELK